MITKAIYSFIPTINKKLTLLQRMMLLLSPVSLKEAEPGLEITLYTSKQLKSELEALGKLNPYDRIVELDLKPYSEIDFDTWWDLPKWIALSQESGRFLYSDYDVIFRGPFLDQLGDFSWVWCLEAVEDFYAQNQLVPWYRLPEKAQQIVPRYENVMYNTGILVLDPAEVTLCTTALISYARRLKDIKLRPMETISISQALAGFISMPKLAIRIEEPNSNYYSQIIEHYVGGCKSNAGCRDYEAIKGKLEKAYSKYLQERTVKLFLIHRSIL